MTEALATPQVKQRLAASKAIEAELRAAGRHMEAAHLRSLRVGYTTAVDTCRRLYRDNTSLRDAIKAKGEGGE